MAALVVDNDAEIRRKDLRNFGPDAEIAAEGIDEDERRAIARALIEVMDHKTVGLNELHGAGLSRGVRRASRKKVHQYQMRAKRRPKKLATVASAGADVPRGAMSGHGLGGKHC